MMHDQTVTLDPETGHNSVWLTEIEMRIDELEHEVINDMQWANLHLNLYPVHFTEIPLNLV